MACLLRIHFCELNYTLLVPISICISTTFQGMTFMSIQIKFEHFLKGSGRPQILLIGNGLEYKSGQRSWEQLVDDLTIPGRRDTPGADELPFPLRYELLSTPRDVHNPMQKSDINQEEKRLSVAMKNMVHKSNPLLDKLPGLHMDHIFTTNYSYCLEQAFFPNLDFRKGAVRSKLRLDLRNEEMKKDRKRELHYRLHTCYHFGLDSDRDNGTGLWHIHGESSVSRGIILGHDRYGRMLSFIVQCCEEMDQRVCNAKSDKINFISWPALFLFGDIYILGFGFDTCEFDLWWLLRRKLRERNSDGKVYFYDKPPFTEKREVHHLLLKANGAEILTAGANESTSYDTFYTSALDDIYAKTLRNRGRLE